MSTTVRRHLRMVSEVLRPRSIAERRTEEGRSAERHRRVVLSAGASALAKGLSVATILITIPLTLGYLGPQLFGVWLTLSGFSTVIEFADLGVGNGLLTAAARATGLENVEDLRSYVASAFALLTTVATILLGAFLVASTRVDWGSAFNVSGASARHQATTAVTIFVVGFALALPLSIVQKLQLGLQMGFMASLWQCVGSLSSLGGVLVAVHQHASLPWLVVAFSAEPLIVALGNSLYFFGRIAPQYRPSLRHISSHRAAELARLGGLFFILQIAVAVTFSSDNIVISHSLGAAYVPRYAVPDRIFSFCPMLVALAVTPLWAAFGEALARGDRAWARRTLFRGTLVASAFAGGVSVLLVFTAPTIIHLWVGHDIGRPSFFLLLGMAAWRTTESGFNCASMYLNGLRAVRLQVVCALLTMTAAISFKLLLLPHFGVTAVPWCTLVSYWGLLGIPVIIYLTRHLGEASRSTDSTMVVGVR